MKIPAKVLSFFIVAILLLAMFSVPTIRYIQTEDAPGSAADGFRTEIAADKPEQAAYSPDDAIVLDDYIKDLSALVKNHWNGRYISVISFRLNNTKIMFGKAKQVDLGTGIAPYADDNDQIMIPTKMLSEVPGVTVHINDESGEINIHTGGASLTLSINVKLMVMNGNEVSLDAPPVKNDDAVFIPINAILDGLFFQLDYIPNNNWYCLMKPYQTKRLIVKLYEDELQSLPQTDGLVESIKGPGHIYIMQFESELAAKEAKDKLDPVVVYCEPDLIISTQSAYQSWGVEHIGADKYKEYLESSENVRDVTVAVLDTGVDTAHPFLSGRVAGGWNLVDNNDDVSDGFGHGTHVAGIISEATPRSVTVMPIKVIGEAGGAVSVVNAGVRYAVDNGADIINMSFTTDGPSVSPFTRDTILYASRNGVTVVVAAGNENDQASKYSPANIPEAITVAAIDDSNRRASFSNYGDAVDVAAPGVHIMSSIPDGKYGILHGTSMAAPHVAAAVALIGSDPRYAALGPSGKKAMICELAEGAGEPGVDYGLGYGIVSLASAVAE